MDLQSLRVLADVARHNSFAGAARKRNVSTSTIMRMMDVLEGRIGTSLLVRSTRRVDLTEAGHRLLSGGLPLVDDLEGIIDELRDSDASLEGRLRVTTAFSLGRSLLTAVLRDFLEQHPKVAIDLISSESVIDLEEDNVDAAIRLSDPTRLPDLVVHELRSLQRWVCASPSYIERRGCPGRPQDLEHHDCILFRPVLQRDPWTPASDTWTFRGPGLDVQSVAVNGRMSGNDSDALIAMARDGLGIVMMPDWLVADDVAEGRLCRLLDNVEANWRSEPKSLHIAYPPHRRRSRKVQAFVRHVRRAFDDRVAAPD